MKCITITRACKIKQPQQQQQQQQFQQEEDLGNLLAMLQGNQATLEPTPAPCISALTIEQYLQAVLFQQGRPLPAPSLPPIQHPPTLQESSPMPGGNIGAPELQLLLALLAASVPRHD
mmetsp:Transcript_17891/g.33745  ORF Transcript_17891/g.33745 Transcript_17891/m.33745 type:complete len:118 (-) Transcript_17891:759-1112(-)